MQLQYLVSIVQALSWARDIEALVLKFSIKFFPTLSIMLAQILLELARMAPDTMLPAIIEQGHGKCPSKDNSRQRFSLLELVVPAQNLM